MNIEENNHNHNILEPVDGADDENSENEFAPKKKQKKRKGGKDTTEGVNEIMVDADGEVKAASKKKKKEKKTKRAIVETILWQVGVNSTLPVLEASQIFMPEEISKVL
jgi:hypothetical protein